MTHSPAPEEAIRECLPCPFCGSDKIKDQYIRDGRAVGCMSCGAHVQAFNPYAREAAIAAWNRRAGGEREQQLEAALKEAQATIEGYQIAIADITAPQWNEIETAPKDGTTIWAVLRHDLYPGMGRKDLERWNGLQVPLRHPGIYESDGRTWDHGWNIAAPVGHGGFPDEWIAGWRPLPAPPHAALAGQTEP